MPLCVAGNPPTHFWVLVAGGGAEMLCGLMHEMDVSLDLTGKLDNPAAHRIWGWKIYMEGIGKFPSPLSGWGPECSWAGRPWRLPGQAISLVACPMREAMAALVLALCCMAQPGQAHRRTGKAIGMGHRHWAGKQRLRQVDKTAAHK